MSWGRGEQGRRLQCLIRIGRVTTVDPAKARVRVTFGGDSDSDWLPWLAQRAGVISEWAPPRVGEQVLVVSPGGETNQAVVIGSLFSTGDPAPSNDGEEYRVEIGGSSFSMTPDRITLSSNGSTLELDAAGIRLNGARIDLN